MAKVDDAADAFQGLEHFTYESAIERRNFRLVQLEDGHLNDPIQCTLVACSLDRGIKYHALSYVWGDASKTRSIICNGCRLDVTLNLHAALVRLRWSNNLWGNAPVWIDAICINQTDIKEKTEQIKMMREIYSNASFTIIWLGEEFATEKGVETLRLMKDIWDAVAEKESSQEGVAAAHELINTRAGLGFAADMALWNIWSVLSAKWFSRIWVVQEYAVSSNCLVQIGNNIVHPDFIFDVADILSVSQHWGLVMMPYARQLQKTRTWTFSAGQFGALKQRCQQTPGVKLHVLVRDTMDFRATNQLDGIFALVGLASDVGPDFIDYSLDLRTIHINIAKNALKAFEKGDWSALDYLAYVKGDPFNEEDPKYDLRLPSWATNLRIPEISGTSTFTPLALEYPTNPAPLPVPFHLSFGNNESLQLKANYFDTIKSAVRKNPYGMPIKLCMSSEHYERWTPHLQSWEEQAHTLASTLHAYLTSEDIELVYARTLAFINGSPRDDEETKTRDLNAYAAFKEHLSLLPIVGTYETMQLEPSVPELVALNKRIDEVSGACREYVENFDLYSAWRWFAVTEKGYMGWVPMGAKDEDSICLFQWCRVPFVVRPRTQGGGFTLIGACFTGWGEKIKLFK